MAALGELSLWLGAIALKAEHKGVGFMACAGDHGSDLCRVVERRTDIARESGGVPFRTIQRPGGNFRDPEPQARKPAGNDGGEPQIAGDISASSIGDGIGMLEQPNAEGV